MTDPRAVQDGGVGLLEPESDPGSSRPPLLLGDEAVALGALHAGIAAAYAYPGTPSTEIFEYLEAHAGPDVAARWCTNEKTAYEQALGVSMGGGRALVSRKHVGLNVAADPFVNSALVRIRGGLVVAVADDPGMHSSQNEQDTRYLAEFARVPCLEPATQQEAYEMVREAFDLSERFHVPVVVRMVTRLCHSRAEIRTSPRSPRRVPDRPDDPSSWTLLPANARRLWRELLDTRREMDAWTGDTRWNERSLDTVGEGEAKAPLGIVTAGIGRSHYRENVPLLDEGPPHLHLGAYPLPGERLRALAARVESILVLEEGYPFVEERLRGVLPHQVEILGKGSGHLPPSGELTPDAVREALGLEPAPALRLSSLELPARPPQLCRGCPHRDSYHALSSVLRDVEEWVVTGDIGCYTLGALPPFQVLDSCVCMGASIGMAKGASDAGIRPALAVIGDSTFLHSGLTALADAAADDTDLTVLILDNETVAMTGQQPTTLSHSRLVPLVLALGADEEHVHLVEVHPKKVDELEDALRREVEHPGLSVLVLVRECVESARKRKAAERAEARSGSGS